MCGESAGFFIKSDYAGACGSGFEKKVFFAGARAVRSVFLTVRGRGAAQVRMRGRGAALFARGVVACAGCVSVGVKR